MKSVLITGAKGQLGQSIKKIRSEFTDVALHFFDSNSLDITQQEDVTNIFDEIRPDYCINCAAFTAVDLAETKKEQARAINETGVKNLAEACKDNGSTLIHISTDYVFDGSKDTPYIEEDKVSAVNFYGKTKLEGERIVKETLEKYFIIRTSWLYSEFGHNFVKTMLRLGKERESLKVVNDQHGSPTYAPDLAKAIAKMINSGSDSYGIFHFCNKGVTTWYHFAVEIFRLKKMDVKVSPISSELFPTAAKRSNYSALDSSKFESTFEFKIPKWTESLAKMLPLLS
ncbi:dTDP-4-dehydrorhamnose reductase [Sungkyunkwania multivorans]|uniref:dTDP-4-dehydrorhamnose reductase n=1 Tax=Sungkyunkwania multivorans TaxID=1173618 RepID=A0ABW3D1G8_9FLAO